MPGKDRAAHLGIRQFAEFVEPSGNSLCSGFAHRKQSRPSGSPTAVVGAFAGFAWHRPVLGTRRQIAGSG
jgi:hypothetical protein